MRLFYPSSEGFLDGKHTNGVWKSDNNDINAYNSNFAWGYNVGIICSKIPIIRILAPIKAA